MRKYNMEYRPSQRANANAKPTKIDAHITLAKVFDTTDWTDQEIDDIASMAIGEEKVFGNSIYVTRIS